MPTSITEIWQGKLKVELSLYKVIRFNYMKTRNPDKAQFSAADWFGVALIETESLTS